MSWLNFSQISVGDFNSDFIFVIDSIPRIAETNSRYCVPHKFMSKYVIRSFGEGIASRGLDTACIALP